MTDPPVGWLVVVAGPGRGSVATLGLGRNSIGRTSENRVTLGEHDKKISGVNHCEIIYDAHNRQVLHSGQGQQEPDVRGRPGSAGPGCPRSARAHKGGRYHSAVCAFVRRALRLGARVLNSTQTTGPRGFEDLVGAGRIPGSRRYQEDYFLIKLPGGGTTIDLLMILADGMGGHLGGAEASKLAVQTFAEAFERASGSISARLRASLDAANAAVKQYAAENIGCRGMGCTLVACAVSKDEVAHWISVGDSPLWLVPAGGASAIERLNEDHSMKPLLEEWARLGQISEAEVANGPVHQLRSAVTGDELTLVDQDRMVELANGDWIVMASDGLETLSEAGIQRTCGRGQTPEAVAADLLSSVEAAGRQAQDNASVVIYQHTMGGAMSNRQSRLTAQTISIRLKKTLDTETSANGNKTHQG